MAVDAETSASGLPLFAESQAVPGRRHPHVRSAQRVRCRVDERQGERGSPSVPRGRRATASRSRSHRSCFVLWAGPGPTLANGLPHTCDRQDYAVIIPRSAAPELAAARPIHLSVTLHTRAPFQLATDGRQIVPETGDAFDQDVPAPVASPAVAAGAPASVPAAIATGPRPRCVAGRPVVVVVPRLEWAYKPGSWTASGVSDRAFDRETSTSAVASGAPAAQPTDHAYRAEADAAVAYFEQLLAETTADGWFAFGEASGPTLGRPRPRWCGAAGGTCGRVTNIPSAGWRGRPIVRVLERRCPNVPQKHCWLVGRCRAWRRVPAGIQPRGDSGDDHARSSPPEVYASMDDRSIAAAECLLTLC